jgi:hypothetical protein
MLSKEESLNHLIALGSPWLIRFEDLLLKSSFIPNRIVVEEDVEGSAIVYEETVEARCFFLNCLLAGDVAEVGVAAALLFELTLEEMEEVVDCPPMLPILLVLLCVERFLC